HIGVGDVLRSLGEKLGIPGVTSPLDATQESIVWDLRVPRVLLAGLVGGMLAIAGATYQGVFHNPLADPYLLGVAAGAGLGATLATAYLPEALTSLSRPAPMRSRDGRCSGSPHSPARPSRWWSRTPSAARPDARATRR